MQKKHLFLNFGLQALVVSICSFPLSGCGDSGPPDTRPERVLFSGVAKLNGAPLQDTFITFHPDSNPGYGASGKTDERGNFVMGTFSGSDGVVPGSYKVSAMKNEAAANPSVGVSDDSPEYDGAPPLEESAAEAKSLLPAKFEDPKTSGVTVTVTEANEEFVLELK